MKILKNIIYTLTILGIFTVDSDCWPLKWSALGLTIVSIIIAAIETRKEEL